MSRTSLRPRLFRPAGLAAALLCLLVAASCGGDDGAGVRNEGSGSGSGGSGSGSGISEGDLAEKSDDPQVQAATATYAQYVEDQVNALVTDAKAFTDAVRAGDVALARELYAPSRVRWERIEPIAALVGDIDASVDSRVDDHDGETDPDFTGWHRLEYLLWVGNTTEGATPFADQLDADLATLRDRVPELEITALASLRGATELIEEVFRGKITGEEDRYSHTDLWDFRANVDGSIAVIQAFEEPLREVDNDLFDTLIADFAAVDRSLTEYRNPDGTFRSYTELATDDKERMTAELSTLAEHLATVPAALGLG